MKDSCAQHWLGSFLFITGWHRAGEVLGRGQLPGAATPALDTEGEAFGDRGGGPSPG